jgi:hypothetical protein
MPDRALRTSINTSQAGHVCLTNCRSSGTAMDGAMNNRSAATEEGGNLAEALPFAVQSRRDCPEIGGFMIKAIRPVWYVAGWGFADGMDAAIGWNGD